MDLIDIDAVLDELEEEETKARPTHHSERNMDFVLDSSFDGRRIPPDPAPSSVRLKANADLLLSMANFSEETNQPFVPSFSKQDPPPTPLSRRDVDVQVSSAPIVYPAKETLPESEPKKITEAPSDFAQKDYQLTEDQTNYNPVEANTAEAQQEAKTSSKRSMTLESFASDAQTVSSVTTTAEFDAKLDAMETESLGNIVVSYPTVSNVRLSITTPIKETDNTPPYSPVENEENTSQEKVVFKDDSPPPYSEVEEPVVNNEPTSRDEPMVIGKEANVDASENSSAESCCQPTEEMVNKFEETLGEEITESEAPLESKEENGVAPGVELNYSDWKMEPAVKPVGFKMMEDVDHLSDISDSELDAYLGQETPAQTLPDVCLSLSDSLAVYVPEEESENSIEFVSPRQNDSPPPAMQDSASSLQVTSDELELPVPTVAEDFTTPPESPEKVSAVSPDDERIGTIARNSCDIASGSADEDEVRIGEDDDEEEETEPNDGDYVTLSFDSEAPASSLEQSAIMVSSEDIEAAERVPEENSAIETSEIEETELSQEEAPDELPSENREEEQAIEEASLSIESSVEIVPDASQAEDPPSAPEPTPTPSVVASTHLFPPTLENIRLTESELQLGKVKPVWIPDTDATKCMLCAVKFTMVKRRHHCRACGRVLCAECCNKKASLAYLVGSKEAEQRVCEPCLTTVERIAEFEARQTAAAASPAEAASGSEESPVRGLLRRDSRSSGRKAVTFSDGVRPGSDDNRSEQASGEQPEATPAEAAAAGPSARRPQQPPAFASGNGNRSGRSGRPVSRRTSRAAASTQQEMECFLPKLSAPPGLALEEGGPPSVEATLEGWDWPFVVAEGLRHRGDPEQLMKQMTDPDGPPVEFAIKRNLTVNIKLIKLSCCVGKEVWCLASQGLRCVAQDEIMILIEKTPAENRPPFDILRVYNALYEEALRGTRVSEYDHTVVAAISGLHFGPDGFLGSREHAGFLYIRPTYQCVRKLPVPDKPYLVGLLITRSEVPWAKVLPMRLFYRLGAETRVYPCPLLSQRFRKAMFDDIGHTIMNLLADFRNYSYSLPLVHGCHVHLEETKTSIYIPKSRHFQIESIIQGAQQQHVLSWATDFSREADSHLVCIQNESGGNYLSQTVNIDGKARSITGVTFLVLNGALKASGSVQAKTSIVEDGVMIQIRPEVMETLVSKLRAKEDYTILFEPKEEPSSSGSSEPRLEIVWIEDREGSVLNPGYRSPIDGRKLEGLPCLKVSGKIADHSGGSGPHLLRMTELFVLDTEIPKERLEECQGDLLSMGRHITAASAKAMLPFASELAQTGLRSLGIRVTLGPDLVEFQSGAGGLNLPHPLMPALDSELVPLLYSKASSQTHLITIELILRVLDL